MRHLHTFLGRECAVSCGLYLYLFPHTHIFPFASLLLKTPKNPRRRRKKGETKQNKNLINDIDDESNKKKTTKRTGHSGRARLVRRHKFTHICIMHEYWLLIMYRFPYSRNRFAIKISLSLLTISKSSHYLLFGQCGVPAVCLAATARF